MRWFVGGAPGYWLRADDGRLAEKLAMPVACDPDSLIGAAATFSTLRTFSYIRRDSDGHVPSSFAQIGLPIFKPLGTQFRIPHSMLNGPMTQPELQGARIFAAVGVMIAAGMPQHVHVHREIEPRHLADTLDHLRQPCNVSQLTLGRTTPL